MNNIGIYKITSPSGKVYIGQSWNIKGRFSDYRGSETKRQPKLNNSFLKYGAALHELKIIHALPPDVTQKIMDIYEGLYMSQYKECGTELLNTKEAGSSGKHCEETKLKLKLLTAATQFKKGHLGGMKGKKHSKEAIDGFRLRMIGKPNPMKGKKHGNEARLNMSRGKKGKPSSFKNKKHTAEAILKMSNSQKGKKKPPRSEEYRRNISLAHIGKKCPLASRKVICSKTGIIYSSIGDAAIASGINYSTLSSYLNGSKKNKTTLKYYLNGS